MPEGGPLRVFELPFRTARTVLCAVPQVSYPLCEYNDPQQS
jgi:hypothetical protein